MTILKGSVKKVARDLLGPWRRFWISTICIACQTWRSDSVMRRTGDVTCVRHVDLIQLWGELELSPVSQLNWISEICGWGYGRICIILVTVHYANFYYYILQDALMHCKMHWCTARCTDALQDALMHCKMHWCTARCTENYVILVQAD